MVEGPFKNFNFSSSVTSLSSLSCGLAKKEENVSNAITLNYIEAKITIVRCAWCLGEKAIFAV